MNKLEQFKNEFLLTLEGENKDKILGAFKEVENVFSESIQTRDKAKETNKTLKAKLQDVSSAMDLAEDFTIDDIKNTLNEKQTDTQKIRDEISAKYEEKYTKDIETLTSQANEYKTQLDETNNKYNDSLFDNAVVNSGLLNAFVDEPIARQYVTSLIKEQSIYKDGKIFQKDSTTGDVATKIGTNDPLGVESIVEGITKSINPLYLNRETQGNGGGVPPNQANQKGASADLDTTKYKDANSFMNDAFKNIQG